MTNDQEKPNKPKLTVVEGGLIEDLTEDEVEELVLTVLLVPKLLIQEMMSGNDEEEGEERISNFDYKKLQKNIQSVDLSDIRVLRDVWYTNYKDENFLKKFVKHIVICIASRDKKFYKIDSQSFSWVRILRQMIQLLDPEYKIMKIIEDFKSRSDLQQASTETLVELSKTPFQAIKI